LGQHAFWGKGVRQLRGTLKFLGQALRERKKEKEVMPPGLGRRGSKGEEACGTPPFHEIKMQAGAEDARGVLSFKRTEVGSSPSSGFHNAARGYVLTTSCITLGSLRSLY